MNSQVSISIKKPCTENFNTFTKTNNGGYCNTCTKEVIDFSKMNTQEIEQYFLNNKTQDTCGRFSTHQLKKYPTARGNKTNRLIRKLGLSILALFSLSKVHAQTIKKQTKPIDVPSIKTQDITTEKNLEVKGTVTDNGNPLPGVNVVLEGSTVGTSTDFDGNFVFPEKLKKGDVLVFSYIGMNSKRVTIHNATSAQYVALNVSLTPDSCVLMGKIAVKKAYKSKH